jgi:hypothetical protein
MPRLLPRLEDLHFVVSVVHSRLRREPALPEVAQ